MAIRILVDSGSDITQTEAEQLGIHMIPMVISFSGTDYLDGVDLLPKDFYEKLAESDVLPKTSQINPYRYEKKFKQLTSNGDEVICITLSSKLSGTYRNACTAALQFDGHVHVVDSLNAIIGERFLCLYALKLIQEGKNAIEIVDTLNEVKSRIRVMGVIDTFEYLKKGGRVSAVAAFAGELLSVKPIIHVEEGEVKVIGKVIGTKRGHLFIKNFVNRFGGIDFNMPYGIIYSGTTDEKVNGFKKDCDVLWKEQVENMPAYPIGSTIGTHIGPGGIGIAFFEKR